MGGPFLGRLQLPDHLLVRAAGLLGQKALAHRLATLTQKKEGRKERDEHTQRRGGGIPWDG